MGKKIEIELLDKIIIRGSQFYLFLPVMLFIFFWIDEFLSIFILALLLFCYYRIDRSITFQKGKVSVSNKTILSLVIILFLLTIWLYSSGIGGFVFQNYDHRYKNAIFRDLVTYDWPVFFKDALYNKPTMLCYYLFFWLPAALFGKAGGWYRANFMLFFWSLLGLFLAFGLLVRIRRKISVSEIILLIFFSGLDIVGYLIQKESLPYLGEHIEKWIEQLQYSSITTQLYWAYNQFIPVIIVIFLIFAAGNKKNFISIYALLFPYSPYAVITLIPMIFLWVISDNSGLYAKFCLNLKQIQKNIKDSLSSINIIIPLLMMMIFIPFFLSNSQHTPLDTLSDWFSVKEYLFSILLEFLIYFVLIYPFYKSNISGWLLITTMLVLPFSSTIDCNIIFRGSAPLLLILFLMVSEFLSQKDFIFRRTLLICLLVIGAFTPVTEMYRTIDKTLQGEKSQEVLTFSNNEYIQDSGPRDTLTYVNPSQYLSYEEDYSISFFYRYLVIK